jgi:hypothetical protein
MEGKCDNNIIQSVACGDGGRDDMTKARERIATKMVVVTLKEFAVCVGLAGGAGGDIKGGVEFDEEGHITKIDWKGKNLNGNVSTLGDVLRRMPRLQVLNLCGNKALTGTCEVLCLCSSKAFRGKEKEKCRGLRVHSGSRYPMTSESAASRTRFLIPRFILLPSLCLSFRRRCRQALAPRGHAEREL